MLKATHLNKQENRHQSQKIQRTNGVTECRYINKYGTHDKKARVIQKSLATKRYTIHTEFVSNFTAYGKCSRLTVRNMLNTKNWPEITMDRYEISDAHSSIPSGVS